MHDYYLFPLPRASKWNRPIFDHSEVKIDLFFIVYHLVFMTEPPVFTSFVYCRELAPSTISLLNRWVRGDDS